MSDTPTTRIRRQYVDLPQGQVHLHRREGAGAPLVFLHQTASSAQCFDTLFGELACPNPLIAIDTPGFGASFAPSGEPPMSEYAGWITAVLDELGVNQAHFFGHHTGASLAVEIALTDPQRVLSLMLAGPVFLTAAERTDFEKAYREPIAPERDGSHLQINWDYAAKYNPDCPVDILHTEVCAMLRAWQGRPQAYMAIARHDTQAAAKSLAKGLPVLLLTSKDDFFHTAFDRARQIFPHADIAETAGGNFQPSADPAGVARAIEAFLRSACKSQMED